MASNRSDVLSPVTEVGAHDEELIQRFERALQDKYFYQDLFKLGFNLG